ncbi:PP2C family serine/threonine-protein phosphatase [Pseudacidovorax sp. RU35E]|uniref:PP2C family serine/threonine-protein phosphatase n=1 Tax=Pseudacidovorax sp. RU35E TaxID=1907403 RepID=UPI0009568D5C|nr:PP2C family serine/threonine-protein phosphatase [Pseudacidovorax sp. RU35E]SIR51345.1 Serine/threonine protein phosphatase PrpC [Pseudacidovorax sp. RU35E]
MLRAVGASVTGPGHLVRGEDCQDAHSVRGWRGGWIVAVADGLGSRTHAARGARVAVQSAQAVVRGWRRDAAWHDRPARDVAAEIHRRWTRAIPWHDKSLAATTLLLAICDARGRARVWQIGDGLIVGVVNGTVRVLTPARPGFGNETRALGVDKAWSAWQSAELVLSAPQDMLLLMTDGIADDIAPGLIPGFASAVRSALGKRSRRGAREWLRRELTHWATPAHLDDKTLAAIFLDKTT